jgi:hypothetical protein
VDKITLSSWSSYPEVFALGHKAIVGILDDDVLVEEKIDGSQFSFGLIDGILRVRSKSVEMGLESPESMFEKAVNAVVQIKDLLHPEWTYRAEYLSKPKHNVLAYSRVPKNHLIIFDINDGHESYLLYEDKKKEAERIGFEVVPRLYSGRHFDISQLETLLETESVLGGTTIEGIVVKNYFRFGRDKKVLMGKFVSEKFKEKHTKEWRSSNPSGKDVVGLLIESLRTEARWEKAIQHLREQGQLENSPKDIGKLLKEIQQDVWKEEYDYIVERLISFAKPKIDRGIVSGFPEFYKKRLIESMFEVGNE